MPVEIVTVRAEAVNDFVGRTEREALTTLFGFPVIWHEQRHDFAAMDGSEMVGTAEILIAASIATVQRIVVLPSRRRQGVGRAMLEAAAQTAKYYNCHKMSVTVPHAGGAQQFFEACGYRQEVVLPQHTFKIDMAILRLFLL